MIVIWLILTANLNLIHPFHVSVCDMTYKSDDKHLKISVRMFLDDLEVALIGITGNDKIDFFSSPDSAFLHNTLKNYLLEKIQISIGNKDLELTYLGGEVEGDAMWCYIEHKKVKPFDNMTIKNSVLFDAFDDQENLVHVRNNNVVRSLRMIGDNISGSVRWD